LDVRNQLLSKNIVLTHSLDCVFLYYPLLLVVFEFCQKDIAETAPTDTMSDIKTIPFDGVFVRWEGVHALKSFYYFLLMKNFLLGFLFSKNIGIGTLFGGLCLSRRSLVSSFKPLLLGLLSAGWFKLMFLAACVGESAHEFEKFNGFNGVILRYKTYFNDYR
jgi:hypothetical protein